ncbi:prepilin-type N-terminal cleavage/methylation domain-containing protein [Salmonella enterica subsp. enterica serovar Kottbus]|nr:prepilin-type N-terminal cleavage/methylation domain-containing protein [Salmonella enterica subsp. enterica serovar Kottbus]EHN5888484.1 prepilin-type N-terminal cleavage/methylation domain-containing protein [Salmonella enterica subsp. enterica serovar Newport]
MKINTFRLRETKQKLAARLDKYSELKKQRGMTLLEIIIVLGIIGVIAAGVVILAQRAFDTKAQTDLSDNANTVRTAMKDAYGPVGRYPAVDAADTLTITPTNYSVAPQDGAAVSKLMMLGKLSVTEAKNGISGNYILTGAAQIGSATAPQDGSGAGYFVALNGLNQTQCRSLLNQMGNNWDYVRVIDDAPAGNYGTAGSAVIQLDVVADAATVQTDGTADTINAQTGIYRSLVSPLTFTPDNVISACSNNSSNGIILGSR